MERNGLWALHDVWFAWSFPGTRHLLSPPRQASSMDSAPWLVVLSGPGSRCFLLRHVSLDCAVVRTASHGSGLAYDYIEREVYSGYHHSTIYGFRFAPEGGGGGGPINIETEISLLDAAHPEIFNGQLFRIVYLNDNGRVLKNEAIDIAVLSGEHKGFHRSLDARPVGKWLAIPIGTLFGIFGFFGLRYMEKDAIAAASDDDDPPQS